MFVVRNYKKNRVNESDFYSSFGITLHNTWSWWTSKRSDLMNKLEKRNLFIKYDLKCWWKTLLTKSNPKLFYSIIYIFLNILFYCNWDKFPYYNSEAGNLDNKPSSVIAFVFSCWPEIHCCLRLIHSFPLYRLTWRSHTLLDGIVLLDFDCTIS